MEWKNSFDVLWWDSDEEIEDEEPINKPKLILTKNKAGTGHLISCVENKRVFVREYSLAKHMLNKKECFNYAIEIMKSEEKIKKAIQAVIDYEEPAFITHNLDEFLTKNNIPVN